MGSLMELRRRTIAGIPDYLQLPSAYTRIPYITADGNQVIRSTYLPVQYDEFHIRYKGQSQSGTLISAGNGTYQLVLIGGYSSTGWYYRYFSSTTASAAFDLLTNAWYDLDIDSDGTMHIDGKSIRSAYEGPIDGTGPELYIAERRNWTGRYTGSIAEFSIKNSGEYKMYLIPCKRKLDGKVGMYDTISKEFLTSGRSDFIEGT